MERFGGHQGAKGGVINGFELTKQVRDALDLLKMPQDKLFEVGVFETVALWKETVLPFHQIFGFLGRVFGKEIELFRFQLLKFRQNLFLRIQT